MPTQSRRFSEEEFRRHFPKEETEEDMTKVNGEMSQEEWQEHCSQVSKEDLQASMIRSLYTLVAELSKDTSELVDSRIDELEHKLRQAQDQIKQAEKTNKRLEKKVARLASEKERLCHEVDTHEEALEDTRDAIKDHFRCSDELLDALIERWKTQDTARVTNVDDQIEDRFAMLEFD